MTNVAHRRILRAAPKQHSAHHHSQDRREAASSLKALRHQNHTKELKLRSRRQHIRIHVGLL